MLRSPCKEIEAIKFVALRGRVTKCVKIVNAGEFPMALLASGKVWYDWYGVNLESDELAVASWSHRARSILTGLVALDVISGEVAARHMIAVANVEKVRLEKEAKRDIASLVKRYGATWVTREVRKAKAGR